MKDQRINIGNIALQIREFKNDGDVIIFLHFGGGNLVMWQDVVPYFQDHYHIVLFDLKGHGKSDKPSSGYHIDQLAHEVVLVLKKLAIHRFHIVGSSLGAEVGLSLAATYPEHVLSLVCEGALFSEYGPYGLWDGTEAEFKEHAAQTLEKIRNSPEKVFPSLDALVDESRQLFEKRGWWSDLFEAVKKYDAVETGTGQYTASWGVMAEDYSKNYLFYRFEDYYRKMQCPLLMLPDTYPGQDEREKEVMAGLFELVNRGKIVYVPEWVHPFGWVLAPEGACKAILTFLAEISN